MTKAANAINANAGVSGSITRRRLLATVEQDSTVSWQRVGGFPRPCFTDFRYQPTTEGSRVRNLTRAIAFVLSTFLLLTLAPAPSQATGETAADAAKLAAGGARMSHPEPGATTTSTSTTAPQTTTSTMQPAAISTWMPPGVQGTDVYGGNGTIDWPAQWNLGARFAYVKATEGPGYVNPIYGSQSSGAAAAGLLHGAYHFAIPSRSSGADQARFFYNNGGTWTPDGKTMAPMLDLEWNPYASQGNDCYNMSPAQLTTWVQDFVSTMTSLVGRRITIYTSTSWWSLCVASTAFSSQTLFAARYNQVGPSPLPIGWSTWGFWQYTDSGPFAGGDGDVWNGTYDELVAWSKQGDVVPPTSPSTFSALSPARLLDTRVGNGAVGPVAPGGSVELQVSGRGGVPASGATSVALNVTVTNAQAPGFITVYPTGMAQPTVSSLNFVAGQTVANEVVVRLGSGGKILLYNSSSKSVTLVADIQGYFSAATNSPPGSLVGISPARVLDTRVGVGAPTAPLAAQGTLTLSVGGHGGGPATGGAAVALNVTVTCASKPGFITAYPAGANRPTTSNVNFLAGSTAANLTLVGTNAAGQVDLYNSSAAPVALVADVAGYFLAGTATAPGTYVPLTPARVVDTRAGIGAVAGGTSLVAPLTSTGSIPAAGVAAAVMNVTATNATTSGYLTVYPSGTSLPLASNLNFTAGSTVPNLAIAPLGTNQSVSVYNSVGGTVDVVADIQGYFLG